MEEKIEGDTGIEDAETGAGPTTEPIAPTDAVHRIEALDFVRGVAILAILMVNINSLALPGSSFNTPYLWGQMSKADLWVFSLNYLFIQMKFYSLFSMLFGVGLALQMERLRGRRTIEEGRFFARRLGFLAVAGLLHVALIWRGDILLWYALMAVPVLGLAVLPPRVLYALGALGLLVPTVMLGGELTFADHTRQSEFPVTETMVQPLDPIPYDLRMENMLVESPEGIAYEVELYRHGSFLAISAQRLLWYLWSTINSFAYIFPVIAGYMLIGVGLQKGGFFRSLERRRRGLLVAGMVAGATGLTVTLLGLPLHFHQTAFGSYAGSLLGMLGAIPLSLAYLCLLCLVSTLTPMRRVLAPLRACGRMAFTNYIFQSLVLSVVFNGYGFGFFGRFGYAELLPFVGVIWLIEIIFSTVWLSRRDQGPLEAIWRWFSYSAVRDS